MSDKYDNLKNGQIGLHILIEDGTISQIGLTESQSKMLEIFLASLSNDQKLFKLPKEFNLKLVTNG